MSNAWPTLGRALSAPAHALAASLQVEGRVAFGSAITLCVLGFVVWRVIVALTAPDQPPRS